MIDPFTQQRLKTGIDSIDPNMTDIHTADNATTDPGSRFRLTNGMRPCIVGVHI